MSSLRRSPRVPAVGASSSITGPTGNQNSLAWFSDNSLLPATAFDAIKATADRDLLLNKMKLLGMDQGVLRGNVSTLRVRLREFLVTREAQSAPLTTATPGVLKPSSNKNPKRGSKTVLTPGKRQRSRSPAGGGVRTEEGSQESAMGVRDSSHQDDSHPLQQQRTVMGQVELQGYVQEALEAMGSRFLRPPTDSSTLKHVDSAGKEVNTLHTELQWVKLRNVTPSTLCVVAALCFTMGSVKNFIPFESLLNDGFAVFRVKEIQHGILGSGTSATFAELEFNHWQEGQNPFSVVTQGYDLFQKSFALGEVFSILDNGDSLTCLVARSQDIRSLITGSSDINANLRNSQLRVSSGSQQSANVQQRIGTSTPTFEQFNSFSSASADKHGGMKTLSYEFDGKFLRYFNKIPDLAGRMKECRIILRITDAEVFAAINQGKGELDVSLEDAFQVLVSSGNAWSGPILDGEQSAFGGNRSDLSNTKRYNLLRTVPSLLTVDIFQTLLTLGWARSKEGRMSYYRTVSLSTFAPDSSYFNSVTTRKDVFLGTKSVLVNALHNLEHYFVFAFGHVYEHMCKGIKECLQFGDWSDQKWDMGYTRYSIEMVLYVTFNEIRDIPRVTYLAARPNSNADDISTPRGICNIITSRFNKLKPSIERVTEFQRIFSDAYYRSVLFGSSETVGTTPQNPYSTPPALTQHVPAKLPHAGQSQWCVYDVYSQAGIKNPKTNEPFKCVHGPSCTFKHGDFTTLSKTEQQQLINRWATPSAKGFPRTPPTIAKALSSALDQLRNNPMKKRATNKN